MLQIDKVQQIGRITVFSDHEKYNVFYPLPHQPRFRRDAKGNPVFSFFKYKNPVDRPDGKKGGGFVLFDVEFVVDESELPGLRQALEDQVAAEAQRRGVSPAPALILGTFTYTKGKNALLYPSTFVEKEVPNGATPSLYGNNVSTFALELSAEGAKFFQDAMQAKNGAVVAVRYDLWFWARLPKVTIDGYWNATKFYSFYQTIDTDWNLWSEDSYRETIREQMRSSESMTMNFDWPPGFTDEKQRAPIRDWAYRALEDAVERNMIEAIAPVSEDGRKRPDGIEDVTRDITSTRVASVSVHYREAQTIEYFFAPQGSLQNITALTDFEGKPIKWENHAREIDLDDPFFKQIRVNASANADFANLPIHSVEVKLLYKGRPMANLAEGEPDGEVILNNAAAVAKFAAYVENDDWKYKYSYQVNYRGQSRRYQSPEIETNEGVLTIGVDDVGIIAVDVSAGDLNWTEIDRAMVTFKYEDDGVDPFEQQFQLAQAQPTARVERVIFQPMRKNYQYKVRYFMKNGIEYEGGWKESRSQKLFVNDIFDARRTVAVRGVADFANRVQTVFVDMEYRDAENDYAQTRSQALSAQSPFFEWTFPVINATAGQVTYKATIAYKDGTSETVPPTVATGNTIVLPPAVEAYLEVQVVPDLVDWTQVRLARVSLSYSDPDAKAAFARDFLFSAARKDVTSWKVELKNRQQDTYRYVVTYYMADSLQKTVGPVQTRDRTLILDPAARERARVPSVAVAA